jgi:hypothetical protein
MASRNPPIVVIGEKIPSVRKLMIHGRRDDIFVRPGTKGWEKRGLQAGIVLAGSPVEES